MLNLAFAIALATAADDPLPNPYPTGCFAAAQAHWNARPSDGDPVVFERLSAEFAACAAAESEHVQKRSALVGEYASEVMLMELALIGRDNDGVTSHFRRCETVLAEMAELAQRAGDVALGTWVAKKAGALTTFASRDPRGTGAR
jgi:hypothetical protein